MAQPGVAAEEIQEDLRTMIVAEAASQLFIYRGQAICTAAIMPLFYERRGFQLGWSRNGQLLGHATALVAALVHADAEALRLADYHL